MTKGLFLTKHLVIKSNALLPLVYRQAKDMDPALSFRHHGFVKSPSAALRFIFRHCDVQ
jgi:hypothetical protein